MNTVRILKGGLGDTVHKEKSPQEKAILKMAATKNSGEKLIFLSKSRGGGTEASGTSGIMTATELAKYINEIAETAFDFVFNTALLFFKKVRLDVEEFGEDILLDPSIKETMKKYKSYVSDLELFCPDNDPDEKLQLEAIDETRKEFIDALCLRVKHMARIAKLTFELRHAEDKDEMIKMIDRAKGIDNSKVFVKGGGKNNSLIGVNGRYFNLVPGAFGHFQPIQKFAQTKLFEAVRDRREELETTTEKETKLQEQEVSVTPSSLPALPVVEVSPEELLFCDPTEVSEKTAVLKWKFNGNENTLKIRRVGERLYIVGAGGDAIVRDLKELCNEMEMDEPFVILEHILTKDGENLCLEDSERKYKFNGLIKKGFKMTLRIRTVAGHYIPHRLLPEDAGRKAMAAQSNGNGFKKPRFVKPQGELMTDQEFFYTNEGCSKSLGGYDLVFPLGFNHKVSDEKGQITGEVIVLSQKATARIHRAEENGKDVIILESTSSKELAYLLEKVGVTSYGEDLNGVVMFNDKFPEGQGWKDLVLPLSNGLKLAYGRMKASEPKKS